MDEAELCRDRAARADAAEILGDAAGTPADDAVEQFLCVPGTVRVRRALRADAIQPQLFLVRALEGRLKRVHLCHPLRIAGGSPPCSPLIPHSRWSTRSNSRPAASRASGEKCHGA